MSNCPLCSRSGFSSLISFIYHGPFNPKANSNIASLFIQQIYIFTLVPTHFVIEPRNSYSKQIAVSLLQHLCWSPILVLLPFKQLFNLDLML